ncbi:MAG: GIY-YIG nuclease family protein [Halocynthiibacter sp.]
MGKGQSLELYFIDGRPDGMLTAEVFGWTGHVLSAPRLSLKDAISRDEAEFTGVYILLGDENGEAKAYIGETETLSDRIRTHAKNKDWWERVVMITSTANNLHKAHVKYLEARLVEIAQDARVMPLENGNIPPKPSLTEAATANMEAFLENILMVLPAIRVDMFESGKRKNRTTIAVAPASPEKSVAFFYKRPKHGVEAEAHLIDGKMVVKAGSKARSFWENDKKHSTMSEAKSRHQLIESGVLVTDGKHLVFTQDYTFNSPSLASGTLMCYATNGRTDWKTAEGLTYAEWEAKELGDGA